MRDVRVNTSYRGARRVTYLPVTIEAMLSHLCQKSKHNSIDREITDPAKVSQTRAGVEKDIHGFINLIKSYDYKPNE